MIDADTPRRPPTFGSPLVHSEHMARCEVCGNDYDLAFSVETQDGSRHVFDSFACAIHRMAPICEHCRVQIISPGVEADGHFYCGAHCARAEGRVGVVDRV